MKSTIKGVLFAVAVATLGAGAVGTACAQSTSSAPGAAPAHHMHHGHFRGFGGSSFLGTLLRATRQLSGPYALTTAQQSQIKTILQGARPAHQPGAHPQGLGITVIGDPGNSSYPTAIQNAITAATNRINKDSTLSAEIYNHVLTSGPQGQQGQIETVLASMQAKEQARRAAWAAKHANSGNG
jgi:hypothetical protein